MLYRVYLVCFYNGMIFVTACFVSSCRRTGRAGNKGYAFTFITPEQERYAGDIIKALELSGATVNADLEKLWNDYKERAKAVSKG